MNRDTDQTVPACTTMRAVFQHPLLEGDSSATTLAEQRLERELMSRARTACASCPLFEQCLGNAVLHHDVAGFAAGTTPRQRSRMRTALGVRVRPDDFETMAGIIHRGHQIATQDVVRMRRMHPDQPLTFIADRLGCSLSTVKRHLRRARDTESQSSQSPKRMPKATSLAAAWETVTGRSWPCRAPLAA